MPDNIPSIDAIIESEEYQITGRGPDNYSARFHKKVHIKSTATDSGNTPTTTLRGGLILGRKTSDGLDYKYDKTANDGTQIPIGIVEGPSINMLKNGTAADRFTKVLAGGLLKDHANDLVNEDLQALAVLLRSGFQVMDGPHGSSFLLQPRGRKFLDGTTLSGAYTSTIADHGLLLSIITALVNVTLPDLATVGPGFEVLIYNAVDGSSVITSPVADKIIYGDAGGALATTLTFSTANKKMGGQALMRADYGTDGTTLQWYALNVVGATSA